MHQIQYFARSALWQNTKMSLPDDAAQPGNRLLRQCYCIVALTNACVGEARYFYVLWMRQVAADARRTRSRWLSYASDANFNPYVDEVGLLDTNHRPPMKFKAELTYHVANRLVLFFCFG